MKLLIFYLTDCNRHYTFPHFIELLNKSNKKNKWKLMILTHTGDNYFYNTFLHDKNINYDILNVSPHNNYMTKVHLATTYAENNNIPYMMKCDNDVFLHSSTLDYMIDNLDILNNNEILTLGPILSSGIPGVEYFTEKFLSYDHKIILEKMYLNTSFYNRDGAIYENLNKYTINSQLWNKSDFFNEVKNMNHHYKGIHHIRFNYAANIYLNNCIIKNKDNFFEQNPNGIIIDNVSPYLCDTIFCIKTNIYKNIINDNSLFVDAYDEVPLNKYAWNNKMSHAFIDNSFAIHITYNWNNNIIEYEKEFCNNLFN